MTQAKASSEESFRGFSDSETENSTIIDNSAMALALAKEERDGLIECLVRLEKFVENSGIVELEQVEARLKRLERCWEHFVKVSKEIRQFDDQHNKKENFAIFADFDERVCVLTGRLKRMQRSSNVPKKDENMSNVTNTSTGGMKLPKMALPEFQGKFDEWLQFRDMYEQMVHNNITLSKVEKVYVVQVVS